MNPKRESMRWLVFGVLAVSIAIIAGCQAIADNISGCDKYTGQGLQRCRDFFRGCANRTGFPGAPGSDVAQLNCMHNYGY